MNDLDMLIDTLVSDAQIETGADMEWLQARGMVARPRIQDTDRKIRILPPAWTEEEEQFYRDHLSDMSLAEIAQALGRSDNAVKVHRFRAGLPSHRRTPGYLTTHQVAVLLGVDSHAPPVWVDHGVMPGELVKYDDFKMRRVRLEDFKRWLTRPESWIYFNVEKIKNPSLKRLVQLAQERWGDEWWSTRQAADYLGLTVEDISRQIELGKLYGIQAKLLGGRHFKQRWAYWFVRKSDAVKIHIDPHAEKGGWTARSDAFILRAMAEGVIYEDIAARMKWGKKRVEYRARLLIKRMTPAVERLPVDGADCIVSDERGKVWSAIYTDEGWLITVNGTSRGESRGEPGKIVAWTEGEL